MGDSLATAQFFIFVTQVYFCSMYAVVLWDWIISLPREWRFIWKTQWTPVKVSYLFCRYWVIFTVPLLLFCFVVDHTLVTCQKIYKIPVAFAMWNQVGSESVLLIRTYAFFNRNNYLLAFMISALSGMVAYQLYVDTCQMDLLPFVKPPFDVGPCLPMSKPHSAHLLGFFIAPLLFDTIITSITVVKAFGIRRRSGGPSSRLIQTFLREGVFYYILISIANLINGIFYLQPRQSISAINIPLSVMLSPVLACRLILDLRERGSETVAQSTLGPFNACSPSTTSPKSHHTVTPPGLGIRSKSSAIYGSPGLGFKFVTETGPHATFKSDVILGESEIDIVELDKMNSDALVDIDLMRDEEEALGHKICGDGGEDLPTPVYATVDVDIGPPALLRALSASRRGISGIRIDIEKTTRPT